jgi:hypothetical protein
LNQERVIIINFIVEIVEMLARTINIEAETTEEALTIVSQRYRNEDIVLDSSDFVDVDFIVKEIEIPK